MNDTDRRLPLRLSFYISCVIALFMTILIPIPLIGVVPFLVAYPLHLIWPELSETGPLVEIGFMWVVIKQDWLWPVFFTYFVLLFFLPVRFVVYVFDRIKARVLKAANVPSDSPAAKP